MNQKIEEFKMEQLMDENKADRCNSTLFIGKSFSGKTTKIKSLIYTARKYFEIIIVISGTGNATYGKIIPSSCIFTVYPAKKIERIIEYQKKLYDDKTAKKSRVLIIFDDISNFVDQMKKDQSITEIINAGRNYGIKVVMSVQGTKMIERKLRGLFQYVFIIGNGVTNAVLKDITEFYWDSALGGMKETREFYGKIIKSKKNNSMVIDASGTFNKDQVGIYQYFVPDELMKTLDNPELFKSKNELLNIANKVYYDHNWKDKNALII